MIGSAVNCNVAQPLPAAIDGSACLCCTIPQLTQQRQLLLPGVYYIHVAYMWRGTACSFVFDRGSTLLYCTPGCYCLYRCEQPLPWCDFAAGSVCQVLFVAVANVPGL